MPVSLWSFNSSNYIPKFALDWAGHLAPEFDPIHNQKAKGPGNEMVYTSLKEVTRKYLQPLPPKQCPARDRPRGVALHEQSKLLDQRPPGLEPIGLRVISGFFF